MKLKSKLSIITILSTVCGIFCVFFFCKSFFASNINDKKLIQPMISDQDNKACECAEIIIKDLILKEIEKNKGLQVIINAHEGKIVHSDDKIQCKSIHCSLCNKSKQIADLFASDAIINKSTKNIFLNGRATVHFDDITINGKEVQYNYSNQILSTKKQTEYDHPSFKLLAQQSTVNFKKNKIKMSGGVCSVFLNCSAKNSNEYGIGL